MAALRATELTPIVQKTRPAIALVDHRFVEDVQAVRDSVAPDLVVVDLRRRHRGRPRPSRRRSRRRVHRRRHRRRRRRPLRAHVRHHGRPEDHDPLPPRRALDRQHLRPHAARAHARRRGRLHGTARLHLRPRHARRLPAPRRRLRPPHRVGDAGPARRPRRRARRHGAGDRADGVQADPCLRPRSSSCPACGSRCRPASTWRRRRGSRSSEQLGLKVIDGIGATEMLHIFISAAGDDIRPGATGRPVPGYRATILDADGNELGAGQRGPARASSGPSAAATSTTSANAATSSTAGTSPATPSSATPTATTSTARAPTT